MINEDLSSRELNTILVCLECILEADKQVREMITEGHVTESRIKSAYMHLVEIYAKTYNLDITPEQAINSLNRPNSRINKEAK